MEQKLPLYRRADFYVCLAMFLFGGVILWQITTIKVEESRMFPLIALVVIFLTAGSLLYRTIQGKDQSPAAVLIMSGREMILLAILIIAVLLIPILGFFTSCYLLLTASFLLMDNTYRPKVIVKALLVNAVVTAVLFVLFTKALTMVFPTGIYY